MLTVNNLSAGYGEIVILHQIDIELEQGKLGVIVGPNGAGKSTALKAIFGLLRPTTGTVRWRQQIINHYLPESRVELGIAYVPQEFNVFSNLTIGENLAMGAYCCSDKFAARQDYVLSIFPPLAEKRNALANSLSGGQRQMLAIARALMIEPELLLLDEPTVGLSPLYINEIFSLIKLINSKGVSVLMVEQNAKQALEIADIGYVLAAGRNRYQDSGKNLLADPEVASSFLGG